MKAHLRPLIALLCACLLAGEVCAAIAYKRGAVISRSIVLDQNGQPLLVEYGSDGEEIGPLSLGGYGGSVDSLTLMAAAEYQQHVQAYRDYLQANPGDLASDARLMDRNEIASATFTAADGSTAIPAPRLRANTQSALIRGQRTRYASQGSQALILLEFPVNLKQIEPVDNAKTVLLNEDGYVVASSAYDVGYRTGFWGDPNDPASIFIGGFRKPDDQIFGPVPGVKVTVGAAPGAAGTDEEGKYHLAFYLPPCPPGGFTFTTDVYAELHYQNFLPTGAPVMPYYLRRQDWTTCTRPAYGGGLPFVPVFYGTSENMPSTYPIDLYVDVMFLTGQVALINTDGGIVPVDAATQYTALSGDEEITAYHYDFNADGTRDTAVAGTWKTVTVDGVSGEAFVPQGSQYWSGGDTVTHFGIYFDAADVATSSPDLIRIADQQKRLNERAGELSSISADDFKNTDILIFRESTGDLIVERRGLRDAEIAGRPQTGFDDGEQLFSYRVMLRGPRDSDLNIGAITRQGRTYEQFTSEYRMEAPFQRREANHPKAGEYVKVVAINRATGYIGTARARLAAAGEGGYNDLSIPVPPILMRPPNLKVWAERDYTVEQGLTRDEQRNYLIGNEGAASLDDEKIVIYTEWLDHDGSALPKDLGRGDGEQFGLTGRLAKIVAPNTLGDAAQAAGGAQALFPIAPGRRTQAIRISDNLTTAEHFYIHVTGEQKAETPSFDVNGSAAPPYDNRPATLTPFLTPLFNEGEHWLTYNEYRRAKDNHTGAGPEPEKPLPSYAWQYRPEYQFSQYGLEMQAINRIQANSDGSTTATNILNLTTPVLASSDALIEALYSLFASGFERLTPIDGEQQLILALGESESLITVGSDQTITFSNLDSLAALSPEDYLSMRLYTNNDAANILWEFAFGSVSMSVDFNRDGIVDIQPRQVATTGNSQNQAVISDETTPSKPFRFWLNNDYDVVLIRDAPSTASKNCPAMGSLQICEQEDVMSPTVVNSSNAFIESERDLEDFAPLALNIGGHAQGDFPFGEYRLVLQANGFSINLFQGNWEEGDEYTWDSTVATNQANAQFIATLADGVAINVTPSQYQRMEFDDAGVAKLIFEGVSGSSTCVNAPDTCYLELSIVETSSSRKVASSKVYMDLHDIKDFYEHYTSGQGAGDIPGAASLVPGPGIAVDLFPKDDPNEKLDYIMFVHGWRMQNTERVSFAETTLKRLYWSGYKGKFGAYTWPTTWFYKPAYIGVLDTLTYVVQDLTNYSRGEKIARQTGRYLADRLTIVKGNNKSLQVIAHSMGNVVVGEALKVIQPGVVDNYIATQAATSAGGYNNAEGDMNVVFGGAANDTVTTDNFWSWLAGGLCVPLANLSFEDAWRCASVVEDGLLDSDYDIPPDHYRYTINTEQHGLPPSGVGITSSPYYAGISSKTNIHNFYNPVDSALEGWRLQQVTKPDSGMQISDASNPTTGWFYDMTKADPNQPNNTPVRDIYTRDGTPLNWSAQDDRFEIMASIVPSRTGPMGQKQVCSAGEVMGACVDLGVVFGFTDSNYDHSAQWLHAYHRRYRYWDTVCTTFFGINSTCIQR